MTPQAHTGSRIRADREIIPLLEAISADELEGTRTLGPPETEVPHTRADELLARAVWSRLTEPGDSVAGAVIATLGALTALDLVASGSSAREFFQALDAHASEHALPTQQQLGASLKRWWPRLDRNATLDDLRAAASAGARLLTPESAAWPGMLDDLGTHAPHALWVRGSLRLLGENSLAVVGARACTSYGTQVTADLTAEACGVGLSIVSGAAYGVDAAAHRTALALDSPTVAVLAGGVDRAYPASHDQLLSRITAQGTVCSELVPGSAPTRWRFLQRNRLISSLASAVLVTEAGVRSGTINTAGHAAELGRALGAVPGPITSAASAGCHRLIREYGASLITNGDELRELCEISLESTLFGVDPTSDTGKERRPSVHVRLLDALPLRGGRSADDAARLAGVGLDEAAQTFAELELLGYVSRNETPATGESTWTLLRRE